MTKGLNEAKAFLRQFRSLITFAQVLDELGDVDSMLAMTKAEKAQLDEEISQIRGEAARLTEDNRQAQMQLQSASARIDIAKREAEKIIADAKRQGDLTKAAMLGEAAAEVKTYREKAKAEIAEINGLVAQCKAELADARKLYDKTVNDIARLKARL